MENKTGFAAIIIAAISVLIGLAFWPAISPSIGTMTQQYTVVNTTITLPAAGATMELPQCGQKVNTITLTNSTGGLDVISTANYTTSQGVGNDGYLTAKLTLAASSTYAGRTANVTCNYDPKGYVSDGASRGLVGLIAVFLALMIVAAASPNLREWVTDKLGK